MGQIYYLSFRDIGSDSTGVTAGEIYRRPVDPKTDWTPEQLTGADWVPWDEVAGVFRRKRVCFIVHGFNVPLDHGVKTGGPAAQEYEALGELAVRMTGADMVVPVLWPGDGFIAWSYFTAFTHCKTTGARFADFLLSRAFSPDEVSFVSHSLGARVVLEGVSQAVQRVTPPQALQFGLAIMAAAAVDDNVLDTGAYQAGLAALPRVVVLSSMDDTVLDRWFVLGDAIEGALWDDYRDAGGGDGRALGRFGPTFVDGSTVRGKTEWYEITDGQDHGDYLPEAYGDPSPPPYVNGWSDKRERVARFCDGIVANKPLSSVLAGKFHDRTARFRPDWTTTLP